MPRQSATEPASSIISAKPFRPRWSHLLTMPCAPLPGVVGQIIACTVKLPSVSSNGRLSTSA